MNPVVDKYLEFIFMNQRSSLLVSASGSDRFSTFDLGEPVHSFDENMDIV
jgi:hypothetical protein